MQSVKMALVWLWSKRVWLGMVVILGVLSWSQVREGKSEEERTTATVTRRDLVKTLEVSGEVDAKEKVDLHFVAGSRLSWVGVSQGDWVNKWQAIASVDTRTLQKQLMQDLNNFAKEFRDHDQVLDDYDFYGTPDLNREVRRILENAQFDLENEVLDVEIRDLAIRLSSLVSPIAGIVTLMDEPLAGVNVSPTDIFQIVNPETIVLRVVVDEEDIGLVRLNQNAVIELDAFLDEMIETSVNWIAFSPSVSEGGGTGYEVEFLLPVNNETLKYKLGMNGTVEIVLDKKNEVLAIPSEIVIFRDGKWFVDKSVNGEVERVGIEVGLETDDYLEVISGLVEGDEVVLPNGREN